jgi:hypothetical protein
MTRPLLLTIVPRDDRLHKGIGVTAGGNGNSIVLQSGKVRLSFSLIDLTERFHKGIVLTVAGGVGLIFFPIDLTLRLAIGFKTITR